jgi:hypothetical protein
MKIKKAGPGHGSAMAGLMRLSLEYPRLAELRVLRQTTTQRSMVFAMDLSARTRIES